MDNQNAIDQELITLRTPTHSDFLVHWSGYDIAKRHDIKRPNERPLPDCVIQEYLERLLNILRYGLWLTKRKDREYIRLKIDQEEKKIEKPRIARVCFTELKLSDSLLHARNFGSLGIGVKRYYLFNRFGAPMHYVHDTPNLFLPPYSNIFAEGAPDCELLSFFKNMSSGRDIQNYIEYDLYEESEWRIIYSQKIKEKLPDNVNKYFVDPKDTANKEHHAFYNGLPLDARPEYLTPLDEWTALIIYPNLQIKNEAYSNPQIRAELQKLKSMDKVKDPTKRIVEKGCPTDEIASQVMEINIGAIKNF